MPPADLYAGQFRDTAPGTQLLLARCPGALGGLRSRGSPGQWAGPPPPHPLTRTCQVGLLDVLILPSHQSGFTAAPRETESSAAFPLCASLPNTCCRGCRWCRGERNAGAGFAHLGAAGGFGRQMEALVKTHRDRMITPTILGKRRSWRGWESKRRASPSGREVRMGPWRL